MDTIVALATPVGRGAIGVIRVSGPLVTQVMQQILRQSLQPRTAQFSSFWNNQGVVIDQGVALFFKKPFSFTGEDILELQGHGGSIVLDRLLKTVLETPGVRIARPGEFSEQAFLNNKIDLAQAEAIADLIDAQSTQAAECAVRSLQGEFSSAIQAQVKALIHLRKYVEASIDFPEEEIDFLADESIQRMLEKLIVSVKHILTQAKQGRLMREGIHAVIAGRPNAGKSSLLNALIGEARAIVTEIPGTTRDILRETIVVDGLPIHLVDTAGLRDSADLVEQEGIRRARAALQQADLILLIQDITDPSDLESLKQLCLQEIKRKVPVIIVKNKIDLRSIQPGFLKEDEEIHCYVSIREGQGLDELKQQLKQAAGLGISAEGIFLARRRHLEALQCALKHLEEGWPHLSFPIQGELLAEELRLAQESLSTITGEFRADDLLGEIFSSFCIGK